MGLLSNTKEKAKAAAAAKAKETGKRAGKKVLHGRNHCRRSPSDVHQYQVETITTKDDDDVSHTFRLLVCRHCSDPKPGQRHW